MKSGKPRLAFVSPLFLFPNDAGGKIRTTNILRGLHGGVFDVTLISPATTQQTSDWASELQGVCDRFVGWQPSPAKPRWQRALHLLGELPANVASDCMPQAIATVRDTLVCGDFDVAVFDFVHAAVLMPEQFKGARVCFTHNVEAEIFERHAATTRGTLMQPVWSSQSRKMRRFERDSLRRFDRVVAVSDRDAKHFRENYDLRSTSVIPTGVDLDFFSWHAPPAIGAGDAPTIVFTGSMDWAANVGGVEFFVDYVLPLVVERLPQARLVVVGRNPPAALVERTRTRPVTFTGFVDDVRSYVGAAHAFVIPLRVGSGTRIKAFEAMSMGCPIVSTTIGIEGLDVTPAEHYLRADTAPELADALVRLLLDAQLRLDLSRRARDRVEQKFGHRVAAAAFEAICSGALRNDFYDK